MNSTAPSPTGQAAAREGVAALRARAWLVVLLVIAGIVLGYLLGKDNGSVYRVWINAQSLGANRAVTEIGISTPEGPQAADFLDGYVLKRLERTTGESYGFLIDHLIIAQPPNGGPNPPILLVAEVDDKAESRQLLKEWLAAIRVIRTVRTQKAVDRGERGLVKDLAKAERQGRSSDADRLGNLLARLQTLRATLTADYAIAKPPREVPLETESRKRSALVGGLAGLIAGAALALVIALLDGRMRTREGVEAASGLELFADLRSPGKVPSGEHAKSRLQALGDGSLPSPILWVAAGKADAADAAAKLSAALGEGAELKPAGRIGEPEAPGLLSQAGAVLVVASPGGVRRAELADMRAELGGISEAPVGLVIV